MVWYGLVWFGLNSEAACTVGSERFCVGSGRLSVWMGLKSGGWVGQMTR